MELVFEHQKHVQYFLYHLKSLPAAYGSLDSSRMTVLYFALSGLDVLNALDQINDQKRQSIIDWVYAQQVLPSADSIQHCGFRGSPFIGCTHCESGSVSSHPLDSAHIAMTYTALCILRILNDDMRRVCRAEIAQSLRFLQEPDGSFKSVLNGSEKDMRFIFCAFAISSMLDDWSGFDVDLSINFIANSQCFDGAFGLAPHAEGHGGSTYCAIASLILSDRIASLSVSSQTSLLHWLSGRQGQGFTGRPNKPADSCYSFWIGSSLRMLHAYEWTSDNLAANRQFVLTCQGKAGGFSKQPGCHADILHSYMSVCGLSLMREPGLNELKVEWGITQRAANNAL